MTHDQHSRQAGLLPWLSVTSSFRLLTYPLGIALRVKSRPEIGRRRKRHE